MCWPPGPETQATSPLSSFPGSPQPTGASPAVLKLVAQGINGERVKNRNSRPGEGSVDQGPSLGSQLHTTCKARAAVVSLSVAQLQWGQRGCSPRPGQMTRAVLDFFFCSFTHTIGPVSLHLLCHLQPPWAERLLARPWPSTASPYHRPSSRPTTVFSALPTRLILSLSPTHSLKCFLKELRCCFVSLGVFQRNRTNRVRVSVCVKRCILRN